MHWSTGWANRRWKRLGRKIDHRPGARYVFQVETMVTGSTDAHKRARFTLNYRRPGCQAVTNKNQKLMESPGNEQRSEREGQPLGPPGIKAPLTLVGVSAEISNGNPIGVYRGKIVSVASGRPIVRNFRHWKRRGRPEIPRDQPVPVTPKWTGDRWATRRRSSEIWTGGCGR